ncbi:MAG: fibronectin type III domain-containing protein [Verrucomicrobiota bacterium]
MNLTLSFRLTFLAFLTLTGPVFSEAQETNLFEPPAVYLQWQRDPTTTMTIHWHTTNRIETILQFRAAAQSDWFEAKGSNVAMPDTTTERTIHVVELKGLTPKTDYVFRFGEESKEFKFRTMPKNLNEPIRFVEGGDVYHQREWMDNMIQHAAKFDPAFVLVGGDLAYANIRSNKLEAVKRWYDFFDSWKKNGVAPDGRLIPLLCTIGNHEVKGFWGKTPDSAPGFYALFSMPGKQGYNVLDFGNYLSLVLLDSGHTHPIAGIQTQWLKKTLSERQNFSHVFTAYHVPAYPSARQDEAGENGDLTQEIRRNWCPLLEKYGVKISFEHHDHAYKRTFPILANKVNSKGVTYLGDGAFGVELRVAEPEGPRWYLAKTGTIRHFYLVTLYEDQRDILAINDKGEVFDEIYQRVK